MDLTGLIAGMLIIGTGFFVKLFPNLISGYNTMTKAQKDNVDIEGLSTYIRNGFIAIGLIIIFGYYTFKWIGMIMIANTFILIVILIGIMYIVIRANRFDQNKDKDTKSKLKNYFAGFVLVFSIGGIGYGLIPSSVHFHQDSIKFTGMYGTEIDYAKIENVKLTGKRPGIRGRTNGLSLGPIRKGFFTVDGFGKSRLLVHSKQGPYLIISTIDEEIIIINYMQQKDTESIFERLAAIVEE
ncbi:DUF3784 domain-containing protein [Anditalea andensis]|uniref:Bacterial Pleckstrin homology domain-containing protein n=1 Tax=Anditalea andensis TaxID=1048983 RepID=A0A074KTR5_9BACT|nr:DUF3784 domain-containing protein [Anditalea andensis]KEO72304.1 hypothetical protein EL17_16265 [Anditalea andensis]